MSSCTEFGLKKTHTLSGAKVINYTNIKKGAQHENKVNGSNKIINSADFVD
jgi:hypothetical protein